MRARAVGFARRGCMWAISSSGVVALASTLRLLFGGQAAEPPRVDEHHGSLVRSGIADGGLRVASVARRSLLGAGSDDLLSSRFLAGVVETASGEPLAGVAIAEIGAPVGTFSATDGSFRLAIHTEGDLAHIEASRVGFASGRISMAVGGSARIVLHSGHRFELAVLSATTGRPIEGAMVELMSARGGHLLRGATDAAGHLSLTTPAFVLQLYVAKDGHERLQERGYFAAPGETIRRTVRLVDVPPAGRSAGP